VIDRVHFAGAQTHERALALMAGCDLLVINSTHETFPHVALEAMTCGVPVVATAVGGIPEVIRDGENGRLVSSRDEDALYAAVSELLDRKDERDRLSAAGRRTAEGLSVEAMLAETEAVLQAAWRGNGSVGVGERCSRACR
jgi:glycosyltransferase involved in cell wall biosynthesis